VGRDAERGGGRGSNRKIFFGWLKNEEPASDQLVFCLLLRKSKNLSKDLAAASQRHLLLNFARKKISMNIVRAEPHKPLET
jgi:hypothetical protein